MTEKEMKCKLYEQYKIIWMVCRGYNLEDLMKELTDIADYHDDYIFNNEVEGMRADISNIFHVWENNVGFGGQIWACFDEFCSNELIDKNYTYNLIGSMKPDPKLREAYDKFVEENGY